MPVWQLSDDEVETALLEMERAEAALVARRAELVAEADQRGMKDRCKALSTERWLQDRFRLSHRDAKTRVEQARLLAGQPAAHGALAAGMLTAEQAGVIAACLDAVDQLPGWTRSNESRPPTCWSSQAAGLGPRDLAVAAGRLVEHLTRSPSTDTLADTEAVARELAAAEAAAQAAETNTLILKYRPDGSLDYRGRIRPTDVPVATAWLKQADRKLAGCDGFEDDRPARAAPRRPPRHHPPHQPHHQRQRQRRHRQRPDLRARERHHHPRRPPRRGHRRRGAGQRRHPVRSRAPPPRV